MKYLILTSIFLFVIGCGENPAPEEILPYKQEQTSEQEKNLPDSRDENIVPARREKELDHIEFKE